MIKGLINQEGIEIPYDYMSCTEAPKCIKQKFMELKGKIDKSDHKGSSWSKVAAETAAITSKF